MAGMTDEGLSVKRLNDVIDSLKENAVPIFQDLVAPGDIVDTSDSSTIGRIIGLISPSFADLWEAIQEVYWAYDINSAEGIALDNLGALTGIPRRGDIATQADVYVEGNIGTNIQAGYVVKSVTSGQMYNIGGGTIISSFNSIGVGITFSVIQDGIYTLKYRPSGSVSGAYFDINVNVLSTDTQDTVYSKFETEIQINHTSLKTYRRNGVLFVISNVDFQLHDFSATTPVQITKGVGLTTVIGQETGSIEENAISITIISTPTLGWDGVWNPTEAVTGSSKETDAEYRLRLRNTKFQRATNIIESMYTSLYNTDGVTEVIILENDTDVVDEYGNPPHSFLVIVEGGLSSEIARNIWLNRPAGILSNGHITITIIDSFGYPREISFSRPVPKNVYVSMTLTTDSNFPANGESLIKQAVVDYINTLKIGEDVIYSRLYTPINSVPGHQIDSLTVGFDPNPTGTGNLIISFDEKSVTNTSNIVIA